MRRVLRLHCQDGGVTVAASEDRRWFGSTEILVVALIAMALAAGWLRGIVDANEKLATAGTVFCGVFVEPCRSLHSA